MKRKSIVLAAIVVISAMLACNLPSNTPNQPNPDAVLTAAALTVQAQLTTSAPTVLPANTATSAPSAGTPTFTPVSLSTSTAIPAVTATTSCDKALFVTDVSYPDNTPVPAGTNFTKTWRLQNTGSCSWTPSYAVVFVSDNIMNGPTVQALSGNVNPGQTVDVSVNLQAPSSNGTYTGSWGLRNPSGVIFTHFYVQIKVTGGGGGGGGPFAVTNVNYTLSTFNDGSYTGCPIVTAHITVNRAGDIQYHWVRSDGPESAQTLHFSSASTQDVSEKWYLGSGAAGTQWLEIYIDTPNHQNFGSININKCTTP